MIDNPKDRINFSRIAERIKELGIIYVISNNIYFNNQRN